MIWKTSQQMIMKYYTACTDLDRFRYRHTDNFLLSVKWAKTDKWEWSITTTIRNKNVKGVYKPGAKWIIYLHAYLSMKADTMLSVYRTVIGSEPSER